MTIATHGLLSFLLFAVHFFALPLSFQATDKLSSLLDFYTNFDRQPWQHVQSLRSSNRVLDLSLSLRVKPEGWNLLRWLLAQVKGEAAIQAAIRCGASTRYGRRVWPLRALWSEKNIIFICYQ